MPVPASTNSLHQSLERPIQRSSLQSNRAVAPRLDLPNDGVAVALALREGEEDFELHRTEGEGVVETGGMSGG